MTEDEIKLRAQPLTDTDLQDKQAGMNTLCFIMQGFSRELAMIHQSGNSKKLEIPQKLKCKTYF